MPLPLIAAAIIATGAVTGSGGLALGGKGARDLKRAKNLGKLAESDHVARQSDYEVAVAATNKRLGHYGEEQLDALKAVVLRMGDFLRRNAKQVRESERLLVDGIDVTMGAVPGAHKLDKDAVAWLRGAITSGVVGAGVSTGVTTAVGMFGVASTGAAISGLSGAAAESATLAFLGGGSLAAGGGGVALGTVALNFVAVGPAVLVGGFVLSGQGTKALTKAREYEAKVRVAIAEMDQSAARLSGVDRRVEELTGLLSLLRTRAVAALDLLESDPFDAEAHTARFQRALNLVMAVRDVAATPVVDGAGDLNKKTSELAVRYRPMTQEAC